MRCAPTISLFLTTLALLCFIAQPGLPAGLAGSTMLLAESGVPQEAESSAERGSAESAMLRGEKVRQQRNHAVPRLAADPPARRHSRVETRSSLPHPPDICPSSPRAPPTLS